MAITHPPIKLVITIALLSSPAADLTTAPPTVAVATNGVTVPVVRKGALVFELNTLSIVQKLNNNSAKKVSFSLFLKMPRKKK